MLKRIATSSFQLRAVAVRLFRKLLIPLAGIEAISPVLMTNDHILHIRWIIGYGSSEYDFAERIIEGFRSFPLHQQPMMVIVTGPGLELESLDEREMRERGWIRAV